MKCFKKAAAVAAVLAAAVHVLLSPAAAGKFSATLQPASRHALPGALVEISGLAPTGSGRVYAHTDESASIFEIDIASGEIVSTFSLGRPAALGDFEAIALKDGVLALAASTGVIYEATLDPRKRSLAFRTIDTGLGSVCEIEGVAPTAAPGGYFLVCKSMKNRLVIYEWSRERGAFRLIDRKLRGAVPKPKEFRATDLVVDAARGAFLILDSRAGAILEVAMDGGKTRYWRLGGEHRQAEGLALLDDGRLLVADEGKIGEGRIAAAALTLYPPRR